MIDWAGVVTNSLWLLGLAVCLAVLSYADWSTHRANQRLRDALGQPAFRAALWSGLTLFCIGVALSTGSWWERILWGVVALIAAIEVWQAAPRASVKALLQRMGQRTTR